MMQIKLSYKLFGAFFLILVIVVGAMIFARYLFSQNFKDYIQQVELARLRRLLPALQAAYRIHNSWEGVTADARRWQRLMNTPPEFESIDPMPSKDPPRLAEGQPPPESQEGLPPKSPPPPGPPQVLLMDARQQPIIGIAGPNDERQFLSIEVDGRLVGWLGLHKHEPFKSGPPAAVLHRQARQLYFLGSVVVALTALIAFLFTGHLLKPIRQLIQGTRELAQRNFAIRIKPATRDELGQLAENFNAMADTLETFEKIRRQWLTDISHELRTPIAILRCEIEAIEDGVREPTPPRLASLHAEILRLSRLMDDLHLLSLADSDTLYFNMQWVSPGKILQTCVDGYQVLLSQRHLEIDLDLGDIVNVRIKGDADRLGQVFANILENAGKYVQSPGAVKISAQSDDHGLTLYFQDSGPGVPKESLSRLFDRLYRVERSRSRDTGGSGLGLSICRQIIEHHGGRIWADACRMGGLSIGISLPLSRQQN